MEVQYVSDSDPDPDWRIESLGLFSGDQIVLGMGKDLTGNIINAAQTVLRARFAEFSGFQYIAYTDNVTGFCPVAPDCPAVQILYSGMYNSMVVTMVVVF